MAHAFAYPQILLDFGVSDSTADGEKRHQQLKAFFQGRTNRRGQGHDVPATAQVCRCVGMCVVISTRAQRDCYIFAGMPG